MFQPCFLFKPRFRRDCKKQSTVKLLKDLPQTSPFIEISLFASMESEIEQTAIAEKSLHLKEMFPHLERKCDNLRRGPRLMSRLSRQKFGMSRISRPKLGMSRLWRPKHGISRLLRPWWSVATIATVAEVARPNHRDSYLVCPDSRDQELPFPDFRDRKTRARLSRPRRKWRDPAAQEMAWPARPNLAISWLSRPTWRRRDFKKFFRAFSNEVETARL